MKTNRCFLGNNRNWSSMSRIQHWFTPNLLPILLALSWLVFFAILSPFSCISKDTILCSFSIICFSINFLNFSLVKSCSSREILEVLLEPNFTWSFPNCSINSSSLLTLFLLLNSFVCKVLASNPGLTGIETNDRLLHFGYFLVVIGSLKPFDSFLSTSAAFNPV